MHMQISIFKVVTATMKFSTAEWNELQFFNTPLFSGHSSLWFFYVLQPSCFKAGQEISLQSSCKINHWNLTLIYMVLGSIYNQLHEKNRIHGKGPLKEV